MSYPNAMQAYGSYLDSENESLWGSVGRVSEVSFDEYFSAGCVDIEVPLCGGRSVSVVDHSVIWLIQVSVCGNHLYTES